MKKFFQTDVLIGALLAAAVLGVYCLTLSHSVGPEDAGELAVAVQTLGIPHPTGYPLFALLGRVFILFPGGSAIGKLNLFGAVLAASAVFLSFRLFLFLLSERAEAVFGRLPSSKYLRPAGANRAAAALAALSLAFSGTYWAQAVSLEVYALHLFLLALATGLFLRALAERATDPGPKADRLWVLFAYALGLSFANHMMTVLLAPAFLYAFFRVEGWRGAAWLRILAAIPPFLLALSLYLYLPLRAAVGPVMNWGDPATAEAFWKHVTAAQFRFKMFSSWEVAAEKLVQFIAGLPAEFGYAPWLAVAWGLWILRRGNGGLTIFSALIVFACVLYGINYAFNDPNFYLNAYFGIAVVMAFGMRALLGGAWPARAACIALAMFPLGLNYRALDRSRDYAVEDFARNMLNSVDSGGVLFTNEYPYVAGPAYYLQLTEGYRTDVVVLDATLLGNPWYYRQLEQRYPWLVESSRREIGSYRRELERSLRDGSDTREHNARMREMFLSILEKSRRTRSVYVSSGINPAVVPDYHRVPSGMAFLLVPKSEPVVLPAARFFAYRLLPSRRVNARIDRLRIGYAEGYANQGSYRVAAGDMAMGAALLRRALAMHPDFPEAAALLEQLGGPDGRASAPP